VQAAKVSAAVAPALESRAAGSSPRGRPLRSLIRDFVVAAAGFVLLAACSLYSPLFAYFAVLAWAGAVILKAPRIGIALVVFVAPVENLFALDSELFGRIRSILLVLIALRMFAALKVSRAPILWLLAGFAVLVVAHSLQGDAGTKQVVWLMLFFLSLGAVYSLCRHFGTDRSGATLIQVALCATAMFCGAVSFLFLFTASPALVDFQRTLDNLRLFGVQSNPNALAKYLAVALIIMLVDASLRRAAGLWLKVCIAGCGVLLAATGTKSAVLGVVCAVIAAALIGNRRLVASRRFAVVAALAATGYLAWLLALGPIILRHAAGEWVAQNQTNVCYYLDSDPTYMGSCRPGGGSLAQSNQSKSVQSGGQVAQLMQYVLKRELRIDAQIAMHDRNGTTTYTPRTFGLLKIGQRDRTWEGGLKIIAQHWWWGIGGSHEWAAWMQRTVGYPFDSPHNAILETLGGYGVLGLALYLAVIAVFIRNYVGLRNRGLTGWLREANEWTFMAGIVIFAIEMVDVLTVFGVTIHALMAWMIFGTQAGIVDAAASEGHACDQRQPDTPVKQWLAGPTAP